MSWDISITKTEMVVFTKMLFRKNSNGLFENITEELFDEVTEEIFESNMTSNVAPMYNKVFGEGGFRGINGKKTEECAFVLEKAISEMEKNKTELELLNPKNGWGNYEIALKLLKQMFAVCCQNEGAIVSIS